MKLAYLCSVLLLWCMSSLVWADDFQSQLEKIGIPKEKIEVLLKDDINGCDVVNELDKSELKAAGLTTGQAVKVSKLCEPPPPPPSEPAKTAVSCSTELDKKTDLDLLNCLVADPKDSAVLEALKAMPLVQKAEVKTARWAVVNADKKLDAETTHKYLTFLNKGSATPQSKYMSRRTTSIEVALGTESDEWNHPLFDGKSITDGLDEFEVDWSGVPLDVMNALLWARLTGHKSLPYSPTNPNGASALYIAKVAVVNPLTDPVLMKIVEDFKAALDEKDAFALSVDIKKKR